MTLVSVIIPTYNRSALLKQAIESVVAVKQEDIDLEIIVVDDGSTDDTPVVVKNYPVIYLRQRGGLGPAGARNVGLEAARGDYIAFLDDDDVWLPTKLTAELAIFYGHPECGMVCAQAWFCDSNLAERSGPYPPDTEQHQLSISDLLRFPPQVGSILVRRSVAQKILFDSSIRWMEDLDWVLSIARHYPVGYTNVPVLLFRTRPRNNSDRWMFYLGTTRVFRRHTRALNFSSRLRLRPVLWTWRGTFARDYMWDALHNVQARNYLQSAGPLWCALRISLPHVAVLLARLSWAKLARLHTASTSQPLE